MVLMEWSPSHNAHTNRSSVVVYRAVRLWLGLQHDDQELQGRLSVASYAVLEEGLSTANQNGCHVEP